MGGAGEDHRGGLHVDPSALDSLAARWRARAERFDAVAGSVPQPSRPAARCASVAAVAAADAGVARVVSAVRARLRSAAADVESAAMAFRGRDGESADTLTALRGQVWRE